jgi:bifunctional non-homologous end joining protein LigD
MAPRSSPAPDLPDLSRYGRLAEYQRKRRFDVTPEPAGKPVGPRPRVGRRPLAFVVQKHRAGHLHYDLRLEHDGVMLSWAVPKGPSLDPSVKRLAMQVEPHPMDYNQFEGVIPEGEYGGGTVMIWDRGSWMPETDDVNRALAKGDLKFILQGQKLGGSWVLVRTRGDRQWLLIKHRDAAATSEDITVTKSRSAVSRRTMAGIARAAGASERQLALAAAADPPRQADVTPARTATVTAPPAAGAASATRRGRGRRVSGPPRPARATVASRRSSKTDR